jgi:hypothetical protein
LSASQSLPALPSWLASARHQLGRRFNPVIEVAVGSILVVALTWDARLAEPDHGLDNSWIAALHMAAHRDVQWGREIGFTYGPLGFLQFPLAAYPTQALESYFYVLLITLATTAMLLWASYRIFDSRAASVIVTWFGITLLLDPALWQLAYTAPISALAIVSCALIMQGAVPSRLLQFLPFVAGVLSAALLLSKFSLGVLVASLVLYTILVAVPHRLRELALFIATLFVGFVVFWLAAGQHLSAIPDYVRTSQDVVTGYYTTQGGSLGGAVAWSALLVLVIALPAAAYSVRARGGWAMTAFVGLFALFMFQNYKFALLPNGSHLGIYYSGAIAAWFGIRWSTIGRLPAAVALVALFFLFAWGTATSPSSLLDYDGSLTRRLSTDAHGIHQALTPGGIRSIQNDARRSLKERYQVPPAILRAIDGHPVHVAPYEASVAWAYGLNWRPVPIFQPYLGYTHRLDDLNARAYASDTGPSFVLREQLTDKPSDPEGRFHSGASLLALICHFANDRTSNGWELTSRVPDRCSTPKLIKTSLADYGTTVRVPHAGGRMLFLRVQGAADTTLGHLVTTFYRSPHRFVTINEAITRRFAPETAADGWLLNVPARADYPGPFALNLGARTVMLDDEGHSHHRVRLSFYAIAIH